MDRAKPKKSAKAAQANPNEIVGTAYLNVDTESNSAYDISGAQPGHVWITLKSNSSNIPTGLNVELSNQTRNLMRNTGETSIGFWPLQYRMNQQTNNSKQQYDSEMRTALKESRAQSEYTRGAGEVTAEEVERNNRDAAKTKIRSLDHWRGTAGRVEEPDNYYTPKARVAFEITRKQFEQIYSYVNTHREHTFKLKSYNASTFAVHALKAAGLSVGSYKDNVVPQKMFGDMQKQHDQKSATNVQLASNGEIRSLELLNGVNQDIDYAKIARTDNAIERMYGSIVKNMSHPQIGSCVDRAMYESLLTEEQCAAFHKIAVYCQQPDYSIILNTPETTFDYAQTLFTAFADQGRFNTFATGKFVTDPHFNFERVVGASVSKFLVKDNARLQNATPDEILNSFMKFYGDPATVSEDYVEVIQNTFNRHLPEFKLYGENHVRGILKIATEINLQNKTELVRYFDRYFDFRKSNVTLTQADMELYQQIIDMLGDEAAPSKYNQNSLAREIQRAESTRLFSTIHSNTVTINGADKSAVHNAKHINAKNASQDADPNEVVAEAYINVDVGDNTSRSSLKIIGADVGHTWLTLKPSGDQRNLPADIESKLRKTSTGVNTLNLIHSYGETAMGFWPLKNVFNRFVQESASSSEPDKGTILARDIIKRQAGIEMRKMRGFTGGAGDTGHRETDTGFSFFHKVRGRVEEPDDAHNPKARKKFTLTRNQFNKVYQYAEKHRDHEYSLHHYNCTTFAVHALNAAGYNPKGHFSLSWKRTLMPNAMYRELYREAKRDQRNQQESNVTLLKLGENEAHEKHKEDRIGAAGNQRIHGVDKFNMKTDYTNELENALCACAIIQSGEFIPQIPREAIADEGKRLKLLKEFQGTAMVALRKALAGNEFSAKEKSHYLKMAKKCGVVRDNVADLCCKFLDQYYDRACTEEFWQNNSAELSECMDLLQVKAITSFNLHKTIPEERYLAYCITICNSTEPVPSVVEKLDHFFDIIDIDEESLYWCYMNSIVGMLETNPARGKDLFIGFTMTNSYTTSQVFSKTPQLIDKFKDIVLSGYTTQLDIILNILIPIHNGEGIILDWEKNAAADASVETLRYNLSQVIWSVMQEMPLSNGPITPEQSEMLRTAIQKNKTGTYGDYYRDLEEMLNKGNFK